MHCTCSGSGSTKPYCCVHQGAIHDKRKFAGTYQRSRWLSTHASPITLSTTLCQECPSDILHVRPTLLWDLQRHPWTAHMHSPRYAVRIRVPKGATCLSQSVTCMSFRGRMSSTATFKSIHVIGVDGGFADNWCTSTQVGQKHRAVHIDLAIGPVSLKSMMKVILPKPHFLAANPVLAANPGLP